MLWPRLPLPNKRSTRDGETEIVLSTNVPSEAACALADSADTGISSPDLVHWTKPPRILDTMRVAWADSAMWAPSAVEKDGRYSFMWSEGAWTRENYRVAYGIADAPFGPFERTSFVSP